MDTFEKLLATIFVFIVAVLATIQVKSYIDRRHHITISYTIDIVTPDGEVHRTFSKSMDESTIHDPQRLEPFK